MASAPPSTASDAINFRRSLIGVVDSVPELRGVGVVLIDTGTLHRLRPASPGEAMVVFERRLRSQDASFAPVAPVAPLTTPPRTTAAVRQRDAASSPATEWMNLGLNCGGAVLGWIGVVGMSSLAPVTGGVSGLGAVIMYGGAVAASGQCVVSVARTANIQRGRADINQRWDNNRIYFWTMLAADGVGLLGAGGALRELRMTNAALRDAGFSLRAAQRGTTISRPMRRRLTTVLELQGGLEHRVLRLIVSFDSGYSTEQPAHSVCSQVAFLECLAKAARRHTI